MHFDSPFAATGIGSFPHRDEKEVYPTHSPKLPRNPILASISETVLFGRHDCSVFSRISMPKMGRKRTEGLGGYHSGVRQGSRSILLIAGERRA